MAGQGYLKSAEGPKREFLLRFNTPLYAGATLTCQLGDKIWNAEIEASKTGVDEYKDVSLLDIWKRPLLWR